MTQPATPAPRRVLVTGAASGLGAALTAAFRARGDRVLATDVGSGLDRLDQPGLDQPGSGLDRLDHPGLDQPGSGLDRLDHPGLDHPGLDQPGSGLDKLDHPGFVLDVRSDDDWAAARDWVTEHWGGLDVLVNNAGVAGGGRVDVCALDEWQWLTDINLFGVVRGTRTFAPMLKAQGSGLVVNIASLAGLVHPPGMGAYNAVKAAVVAFSETVGHELAPYGVGCAVVCPSYFRTNLMQSLHGADTDVAEKITAMVEQSPLTADQIAEAVLAGIDEGAEVIVPDEPARAAVRLKRDDPGAYAAEMRRTATRMKERA